MVEGCEVEGDIPNLGEGRLQTLDKRIFCNI
jgi:hypothetical protein